VPAVAFPRIFSLPGVIAGVLSLQLSAYLTHAVLRRIDRKAAAAATVGAAVASGSSSSPTNAAAESPPVTIHSS
jgi:hypothetical protein